MNLAISPFPSLIISDVGIYFKSMGSLGYNHIGWHGVRFGKRKGLFKHLYMQLLIPRQIKLNKKQNLFYKIALRVMKLLYQLVTFKFAKLLSNTTDKRDNFQTLRIYRATIGVPLSNIEKLLNDKIELYASNIQSPDLEKSNEYEPAVIRVRTRGFSRTIGKIISMVSITLIIIIPFSMIGLGAFSYNQDLKSDPITQQTQALRKLALSGDADAQNKFGWRLSNGVGLPKSSNRANRWYLLAERQGHAKAQYNVGISYKCRRKKESKCKQSAKWFRKAANNGLHLAQSKLAYQCYKGWGIRKSYVRAFNLFKAAAMKNDGYALYFLGFMYENGRGVERSKENAIHYYKEAIKNGYPKAKKSLNQLAL